MNRLFFILLLPLFAHGQSVETIAKAKAYTNTYMTFGTPYYCFGSDGHRISFVFVNHYYYGQRRNLEVVRTDITAQQTSSKILPIISDVASLWSYGIDSLQNVYIGFNYQRSTILFNFKDSIYYEVLGTNGNIWFDTTRRALVYSYGFGVDNNMYFGSSSGGTFVSYYNPYTKELKRYNILDDNQDYVFTVQGDSNYIYAQVGQRSIVDYYTIRKSDGYFRKMFTLPSSTRFNVKTSKQYCYVNFNGLTYQMNGFDTIRILPNWNNIAYKVATENVGAWVAWFNDVTSDIYYRGTGLFNSIVHVNTDWNLSTVRYINFDRYNTAGFYYWGNYYGGVYWYSYLTDSSYTIGKPNIDIDCSLQINDSITYLVGYPDGALLKWNTKREWTMWKFVNGAIVNGYGANDNPHIEAYLRTNTPAGFHHATAMTLDSAGNIVVCGNVIRVGNGAGIAVYNPSTKQVWGYDWNKIEPGTNARDIVRYKDHILFSTCNPSSPTPSVRPKIYFYNSVTNKMDDSLDFNYYAPFLAGYGKLMIVDDTLIGACGMMLYKVYLPTRQLLITYAPRIPTYGTYQFEHNIIGLNTNEALPNEPYYVKFPYYYGFAFNESVYTISGNNILRITGIYPTPPSQGAVYQNELSSFTAYPNPATTSIYIKGNGQFILRDAQGRILNQRIGSGWFYLNRLPSGTYFINGKKVIKL